jgi:hypothetical protein
MGSIRIFERRMKVTTQRFVADDGVPLLIEISPATEVDETEEPSREWPPNRGVVSSIIRKASDDAIKTAFETIQLMAQNTSKLISALQNQTDQQMPASLDIEFGVSFNGDLQAYVAKVGAEGTVTVKMSWELERAD